MPRKSTQKESEFFLSRSEIDRIIYAAGNFRGRCLLKLLAKTGMRRAEIGALDVRGLDFDKKLIHIREGKGSKARIVLFDGELKSDLGMYLGKRKTGPLFISNKGNAISVRAINDLVARASDKAKVKHPNPRRRAINPHLFRHTFQEPGRRWRGTRVSIKDTRSYLHCHDD
jgi:integrase/recombinase XerD